MLRLDFQDQNVGAVRQYPERNIAHGPVIIRIALCDPHGLPQATPSRGQPYPWKSTARRKGRKLATSILASAKSNDVARL